MQTDTRPVCPKCGRDRSVLAYDCDHPCHDTPERVDDTPREDERCAVDGGPCRDETCGKRSSCPSRSRRWQVVIDFDADSFDDASDKAMGLWMSNAHWYDPNRASISDPEPVKEANNG